MNKVQNSCFQVLTNIASYYVGELKQPITDPYLNATLQYSGKTWNDQGDVDACLRTPSMNFIEAKFYAFDNLVYQGLCLQNVCTAQWMRNNIEFIANLTYSVNFPLKNNYIIFNQYPFQAPSTDNYGFVILSIICIAILTLVSSSLILRIIYSLTQIPVNTPLQTDIEGESFQNKKKLQTKNFQKLSCVSTNYEKINVKKNKNFQNQQEQLQACEQNNKESTILKIIHCWDLKSNAKQLFNIIPRNPDLIAFDCLRVFSFFQVIIGHEYIVKLQLYSNPFNLDIIEAKPFVMFAYGCFYSVDIFLLLGGFFVAYVTTDPKHKEGYSIRRKMRMIKSFFLTIINRFLRIWPSFFFALYFYWQYASHLRSGPLMSEFLNSTKSCDEGNWKTLLFINNLFADDSEECFAWGWYLSVDMQLFVLSIFFMIIYANNSRIGKIIILLGLSILQAISFYVSFKYNLQVFLGLESISNVHLDNYYNRSWTRGPPYLLGLIFGVMYREYIHDRQNMQKNSIISKIAHLLKDTFWKWSSYFFGLFIMIYLVFGVYPLQVNGTDYWSEHFQSFFFGISRLLYSFGAIFVLLPGICGSKDFLIRLMSGSIFQFIAKLSFTGYLLHYIFIEYSQWSLNDLVYFNTENMITITVTDTMLTLIFSIPFVLLIEQPFNNLTNLIFNHKQKKQISNENIIIKQVNSEKKYKVCS